MNNFCHDPCITCAPVPGASGILPDPNAEANPFSNFSSEKPDRVIFFHRDPYGTDGPGDPPVGQPWQAAGCAGVCFSDISQADTDACAFNQKVLCNPPFDYCALFPSDPRCLGVPPPPPPPPQRFFYNDTQQCTVTCPDGSPFTVVVPAGTYLQSTKNQADAIAISVACKKANSQKICLGPLTETGGCLNRFFLATVAVDAAVDNPATFTFTLTGGFLPPGLTLQSNNPRTAFISGFPVVLGQYIFNITVTPSIGVAITKQYTITIADISTPSPLPNATGGTPYSTMLTAAGTSGAVTWAVTAGTLPPGLTLNSATGEISGTPTDVATTTYSFTVTMTN